MVFVIGYVKGHNVFFLLALLFHKGEDKAVKRFVRIFIREFLTSAIDNVLAFAMFTFSHHERDAVAHFKLTPVKRARLKEHAYHVIGAFVYGDRLLRCGFVILLITQVQTRFAILVIVMHNLVAIRVSLVRRLLVKQRNYVSRDIGSERVAHHKVTVGLLRASRDKISTIGILTFILRLLDIHLRRTHLYPNKLPIEIKVIIQVFATLECRVLNGTLCSSAACKQQGADEK